VYSNSDVLIQDRNANVNGKVQELVELKPLPAVEEPTAAVEGVEELWRVRNMNLTTPCQLTGHISSSRKSWISTLSNVKDTALGANLFGPERCSNNQAHVLLVEDQVFMKCSSCHHCSTFCSKHTRIYHLHHMQHMTGSGPL